MATSEHQKLIVDYVSRGVDKSWVYEQIYHITLVLLLVQNYAG